VEALSLKSNGLKGAIPDAIKGLTNLKNITLQGERQVSLAWFFVAVVVGGLWLWLWVRQVRVKRRWYRPSSSVCVLHRGGVG
jgi:hypothetical protein